ncbi:hypothetical protein KC207_13755 [Phycicoccus sp. BSK3Z-2]|uniref:Uncharacterized protein n=1 Tax=Phycicoccus avicenniae TaxID=2828860 RepID=A0A941D934_9MICO|nr:hypothetical protein [Phycicoccus avicenniae]MBR7744354.1 hypothetical protein [Phycicoccus avicenniae]
MPLPMGITLGADTPARSRPHVETGGERNRPADDGTQWCATCDTTVNPRPSPMKFCARCRKQRDAHRQRDGRQGQGRDAIAVSTAHIRRIITANRTLQSRVSVASAENQPGSEQPTWLDDLLIASKRLALAVDDLERELRQPRRSSTR